jgi:hypothetical protein
MNTIMMEVIRQSAHPNAGPLDFSRTDTDLNADRHARYEAAQIRLGQTNALLSRELHFYLARGDLLAKGLLTTDDIGRAERIIPTARWRVMTLDIAKAQATGAGWRYSGIVVGFRPKKPKPQNRASEASRSGTAESAKSAAPPAPPQTNRTVPARQPRPSV